MKKLLVVNLLHPNESIYRNPKNIGAYMWGKSLSNRRFFIVEDSKMTPIILDGIFEITELQNAVNQFFPNLREK